MVPFPPASSGAEAARSPLLRNSPTIRSASSLLVTTATDTVAPSTTPPFVEETPVMLPYGGGLSHPWKTLARNPAAGRIVGGCYGAGGMDSRAWSG